MPSKTIIAQSAARMVTSSCQSGTIRAGRLGLRVALPLRVYDGVVVDGLPARRRHLDHAVADCRLRLNRLAGDWAPSAIAAPWRSWRPGYLHLSKGSSDGRRGLASLNLEPWIV